MEKGSGCNGPLKSSLTSDLCGFILLCAFQGSLDILNKHVFAATIPQKEVKFSAEYVNLNVWCKKNFTGLQSPAYHNFVYHGQ